MSKVMSLRKMLPPELDASVTTFMKTDKDKPVIFTEETREEGFQHVAPVRELFYRRGHERNGWECATEIGGKIYFIKDWALVNDYIKCKRATLDEE